MALFGIICLILPYFANICFAVDDAAVLDIIPPAYLPGVSKDVQMTCRPPVGADVAKVLTIQLLKQKESHVAGHNPVASYVTNDTPLVETFGALMNASVTASYDMDNPHAAFLNVYFPQPTDTAEGRYTCSVETLDRHGLIHRGLGYASLVSLVKNGSVPDFYQKVLIELRTDLDTLISGLHSTSNTQLALASADNKTEAKLQSIGAQGTRISDGIDDVHSVLSDTIQTEEYLRQEMQRLRNITPDAPVSFFAYLSSHYISPSPGNTVVFNVLEQHSDNGYSTATGVFTAPRAGTYYFTTAVSSHTAHQVYMSIEVNGIKMTSLYAYDDYVLKQSMAALVVRLDQGDEVKVVQTSPSTTTIYGYDSSIPNHITYFMGLLLW